MTRLTIGMLAAGLGLVAGGACRRSVPQGVVVEEALAGGAARQAGIRPGDVLWRWEVTTAGGQRRSGLIVDPVALGEVEVAEAPRGRLALEGRRNGKDVSWPMPAGEWRLRTEPRFADAATRARYVALRPALTGAKDDGLEQAVALATEMAGRGQAREAAALLLHAGDLCLDAKQWQRARRAFGKARAVALAAAADLQARAWDGEAVAATKAGDLPGAEAAYREVLRLREPQLGEAGELARALPRTYLAHVLYLRGELDASEQEWRRSLEVRERLIPNTLPLANSLNGLGMVAAVRGRLDEAEGHFERALAIGEKVAPESTATAHMLSNCGYVARHRGDLPTAEQYYRRGLAVFEKTNPDGAEVATALQHLGVLARRRGDLEAAETYLRRALALLEAQAPDGPAVASCLINLGGVHEDRDDRERALAYYRRALDINERVAPEGTEMAITLANVASVTAASGDAAGAARLHERALDIRRRRSPGSLEVAKTLAALGRLALAGGDAARAERLHRESLALRQRLAPRSGVEAESLHDLGIVLRRQGRRREALARWSEALSAIDAQRGRFSDSAQGRSTLGVRYSAVFADAAELSVELGERERAFAILERSRARGFLAMLGERELALSTADAPQALLARQREHDRDYDAAQARLAKRQPGRDDAAIDADLAQLEELRHRRAQTAADIQRASPRVASLQEPEPLDLAGARRVLDPGTRLLAYSVGTERTLLFVLADETALRGALDVFVLPVGRKALQQRVANFRAMIARGRERTAVEPALLAQARRLFDDLVGPARGALTGAARLLVVPDGPLHALPFAALAVAEGPRYLSEEWPLHVAASATVYAEIKKRASPADGAGRLGLLAFGDPRYAGGTTDGRAEDWVLARAGRLVPLPATRAEVESIAALYPGRARVYLGADATEAQAKTEMPRARLLHFACHGLLDTRYPLDSALALSPGGADDNGLLQAWEVIERVRLDAELVTLSACETGLGRDMGGEGLVGLVRAFQYAGARAVLASLWEVSDRSTALLMQRFYAGLRRGLTKDEALRAAQTELRGHPSHAHPYHWAAFQLSGPWN